jgi:hypothetical protein
MPVQRLTTAAIASGPTSGASMGFLGSSLILALIASSMSASAPYLAHAEGEPWPQLRAFLTR